MPGRKVGRGMRVALSRSSDTENVPLPNTILTQRYVVGQVTRLAEVVIRCFNASTSSYDSELWIRLSNE